MAAAASRQVGERTLVLADSTPPCPTMSAALEGCSKQESKARAPDRHPHSWLAGVQAPPCPTKNHWLPHLPATPTMGQRNTLCLGRPPGSANNGDSHGGGMCVGAWLNSLCLCWEAHTGLRSQSSWSSPWQFPYLTFCSFLCK